MKKTILVVFILFLKQVYGQIDTIKWVELSPMPDNRQLAGSGYFLIDSDFYVSGGEPGGGYTTSNTVWQYHIPSDSWQQKRNLPFGGAGTTCSFVLNGKGYFLTSRDSARNGDCDNMLWQYDPNDDMWTRKADFPDSPRQGNSVFICRGKAFVGQTLGCTSDDSHFWEYNPVQDQWTQIATLPGSPRARSSSIAVFSDSAYLFGGMDGNANFYNIFWKYNASQDSWTNMRQMPGLGREFPVIWGLDSILLVGGGVMVDSHSNIYLANDFYKYNYTRNTWTPVVFQNSFDSAGMGAAFIFNRKGYYFGGFSSYSQFSFSNKMWSFDASKYIHDRGVGVVDVSNDNAFKVYPNPVSTNAHFSVSAPENGTITFYDVLGQTILESQLTKGVNTFSCSGLNSQAEVIFYTAKMRSGKTEAGRIVTLK